MVLRTPGPRAKPRFTPARLLRILRASSSLSIWFRAWSLSCFNCRTTLVRFSMVPLGRHCSSETVGQRQFAPSSVDCESVFGKINQKSASGFSTIKCCRISPITFLLAETGRAICLGSRGRKHTRDDDYVAFASLGAGIESLRDGHAEDHPRRHGRVLCFGRAAR